VASKIRVATLNCRNATDQWRRRRGLLLDQLVELAPEVIGLQELRHFVPAQARWIAEGMGARTATAHWLHTTYKTGLWWWWEGIAILTRLPVVERGWLELGGTRVANLVRIELPEGGVLDFYNTHLASRGAGVRAAQAARIVEWMGSRPGVPQVLAGDFNAAPTAKSVGIICQSLSSACVLANGAEPLKTVPTPLRRRRSGRRGQNSNRESVLDYLFVNDKVQVLEAGVTFDVAHPSDPNLYASDHFGLAARVSIG
jgi:endonuclease/exonuclease/phosphatase family metal-dependent hydrolase